MANCPWEKICDDCLNDEYYDDCVCIYECNSTHKAIKRCCEVCLKKFALKYAHDPEYGSAVVEHFVYMEITYMCCIYTHLELIRDLVDHHGLYISKVDDIIEYSLSTGSHLIAGYLYLKNGIKRPDPRPFKLFISKLNKYHLNYIVKDLLWDFINTDPCYSYESLKAVAIEKGIWKEISELIDEPIKEPDI